VAGQGALKEKKMRRTYLPFFEILLRVSGWRDLSDFEKYFYGVFELVMQRNGRKCDKTTRRKKMSEKSFPPLIFFAKSF
jgi:hypothetical protein